MGRTIKWWEDFGGATGLLKTHDVPAIMKWKTCSSEVARNVSEFKDSLYDQNASNSAAKHEENETFWQIQQRC